MIRRRSVELLREVLAGSWRADAPKISVEADELARVLPLLTASGAAALAWTRIRESPLAETEQGHVLREAYRFAALRDAVRGRETAVALARFREAGIEAVLLKGWSVARLYHDPVVRPHGDIDVWVRPDEYTGALALAPELERARCWVDVHASPFELRDRDVEGVFGRALTVTVEGEAVRILAHEDLLALVCIHMLRHGGWRPTWLCDIGVGVEARPPAFDWEMCLGADARRREWILAAIALAHRLVGLEIRGTPAEGKADALPRWLVEAVYRSWEHPEPGLQAPMRHQGPMAVSIRRPMGLIRELRVRWPNPVEASIYTNAPFDSRPRLMYQSLYGLRRARTFVRANFARFF